jgi:hypothetical protein
VRRRRGGNSDSRNELVSYYGLVKLPLDAVAVTAAIPVLSTLFEKKDPHPNRVRLASIYSESEDDDDDDDDDDHDDDMEDSASDAPSPKRGTSSEEVSSDEDMSDGEDEQVSEAKACERFLGSIVANNARYPREFNDALVGRDVVLSDNMSFLEKRSASLVSKRTPDGDDDFGIPFVKILAVENNSPMAAAGFLPGDMIQSFDTLDIDTMPRNLVARDTSQLGAEEQQKQQLAQNECSDAAQRALSVLGVILGEVCEEDLIQRQGWDKWKPRAPIDPGLLHTFVVNKTLRPIMSERIKGVGWIGQTVSAAWDLQKRSAFCSYCKKKGHFEPVCYIKDKNLAKSESQRKRHDRMQVKLAKQREVDIERRDIAKKGRDSYKQKQHKAALRIAVDGKVTHKNAQRWDDPNKVAKPGANYIRFADESVSARAFKVDWGKK